MRLKALDDALKDAFFNGCEGFIKGSETIVVDSEKEDLSQRLVNEIERRTVDGGVALYIRAGDSEKDEVLQPSELELVKVERDLDPEELNYIIYLRNKYKDLEPEIKQEIVRIRKEQALLFLKEREKVIQAQGVTDWGPYYYADYLDQIKDPDIQDFLKACDIIPQGQWLLEEDAFLSCGSVSKNNRQTIHERFSVLLSYYESILKEVLLEKSITPDREKDIGRAVLQAGYKRGEAKRIEKERRQKKCYELYDRKMKNEHRLKSEPKIKQEIADELHCSVRTIRRDLDERTE